MHAENNFIFVSFFPRLKLLMSLFVIANIIKDAVTHYTNKEKDELLIKFVRERSRLEFKGKCQFYKKYI